jgi:hypothetical protein
MHLILLTISLNFAKSKWGIQGDKNSLTLEKDNPL